MPNTTSHESITDHGSLELILSLRDRRTRDARKLAFVEGVRMMLIAERHSTVHSIIYSPKLLRSREARRCIRRLSGTCDVVRVTPELFRQLSTARRASGVGAIVHQGWVRLQELKPGPGQLYLAVRHLMSSGNLGTMVRSADAFGAAGVVLLGQTIDPFDPGVVRASMGASVTMPMTRTTHRKLTRFAGQHADLTILGASPDASAALHEHDFTKPTVVLLGHERHGLTPEDAAICDELVSIPMTGTSSSLNAGVAGSIVAYEAQRAATKPTALQS